MFGVWLPNLRIRPAQNETTLAFPMENERCFGGNGQEHVPLTLFETVVFVRSIEVHFRQLLPEVDVRIGVVFDQRFFI